MVVASKDPSAIRLFHGGIAASRRQCLCIRSVGGSISRNGTRVNHVNHVNHARRRGHISRLDSSHDFIAREIGERSLDGASGSRRERINSVINWQL